MDCQSTHIETRGSASWIITNSDVVQSSKATAVKERIQKPKRFLPGSDTGIVE